MPQTHGLLLVCSSNMCSLCCIQQPIAHSKTMPSPPSTGPSITHIPRVHDCN